MSDYILTGKSLYFLVSNLNFKFLTFCYKNFYAGGLSQNYRNMKNFLQTLPIAKIDEKKQEPFISLVKKLFCIKK